MLLVIGKGRWGETYAQTLKKLKIPFRQATRDWHCFVPDGIIIATPPESHFGIARVALGRKIPVLVEKPIALQASQAHELVSMGGIAFAGHTRLYSPAWREWRRPAKQVRATVADWWDWGPHAVAMAFDLGCETPEITVGGERMTFSADGREFTDTKTDPMPLEVLVREFCAAIEKGEPNNEGLQLGARVIDYLEKNESC